MTDMEESENPERRILSLDLFRGVVMFFLIAEPAGLYDTLGSFPSVGALGQEIGLQFQHHPWIGMRIWDLGQPFFMFISGVAIFFSYSRRWENGETWKESLAQCIKRSTILFTLGWSIYLIIPAARGAFLYDMLPQLAIANLVVFLILRRSVLTQFSISIGLITITEVLYRLWAAMHHSQPFVAGNNFGAFVDRIVLGSISEENWVAFNMVPFTAFVIWGALAGRLLRGSSREARKAWIMVAIGLGGIAVGLALSCFTPIIRRISTISFVIVSGGICFLTFALAYWLIDILKIRKGLPIFLALGANPLVIYLFSQTGGAERLRSTTAPFAAGLAGWAGEWPAEFTAGLLTQVLMLVICFELYRRRIFIRI